jgi:GNAT superfamily N-acetyltransferase
MIHEFAAFERLPIALTEDDLRRDGFNDKPRFRVLIAEWEGQPAGYALFFDFYSSFHGRHGIFLEDIYVRVPFRGKGIGKAVFTRLAVIAQQENCFGLRWQVLDWNTPAIDFYRQLRAEFLDEWKTVNLEGEALQHLARSG